MNIKNILLYIEPNAKVEQISLFTMDLARINNARVFVLSIIRSSAPAKKSRVEEQAWKRLYEVEEDAFEVGIKTSLLLEEMEKIEQNKLTEKIVDICKTFAIGTLIVSSEANVNFKKLVGALMIPVITVPCRQSLVERKE